MSTDAIRTYYRQADENKRAESTTGQFEFIRCMEVLERRLPRQARVLDLGGGPGRYAVELARRGHRVTLVDLCDHHVEQARERLGERGLLTEVDQLCTGDACDLWRHEDDAYDAVVAFGPFYHITDEQRRQCAAREVARVVRDSGRAFVQFIPPMSGFVRLMDRAVESPRALTAVELEEAWTDRRYRNPSDDGFQEGCYMRPDQLEELFGEQGFETVDLKSVFGLAAGREEKLEAIQARNPELYEAFSTIIEETARQPEVVSTGQLAVWVGERVGAA